MAPAQVLSSINDEGKSDVAVKSENKDYADTKDASGIMRAYNDNDAITHAGSSKDLMKVEYVLGERKLGNIVKSENMELLDTEDDVSGLMCANNCEDNVFNAGSSTGLKKVNDVMDDEIDIINWTDNVDVKIVKDEDSDATEYSSSFGETFSGSESESKLERGDMEVDSPFVPSNGDPAVMDDHRRIFK